MRLVAEKAGVSTTAFYRHFKNKTDLKAELMRRGFQVLYEGMEDLTNNFSSYGAHYIRFVTSPHKTGPFKTRDFWQNDSQEKEWFCEEVEVHRRADSVCITAGRNRHEGI